MHDSKPPHGWHEALLDRVTIRGSGHTPDKSKREYWDGHVKWVSLSDSYQLDNFNIVATSKRISDLGLANSSAVLHPPGTVIMSRDAGVGLCGILGERMAVSQHFLAWRCDSKGIIHNHFLYYWLQSKKREFERIANGSTIKTIGLPYFQKLRIRYPGIMEQRRISEILRTWDEAIEHTRALIDDKELEFAAFAASLLTGHRRLHGSSAAWTRHFLGEVTREIGARNGNRYGRERVKAVNKMEGMIPMKDHIIAGDLGRYRIVPPRGFAYNPMRLNIGSIAMNDHGGEVLVSPDYVVFEARPGYLDPDFLNHFRRTSRWQRFMEIAGSGSVRIRIYYDDLAPMPLHLPPIQEQRRIAAYLNLARQELDLRRAELAALEKQKRGLMQKLLTGDWRVFAHEEETGGTVAETAEQEVA